MGIAIKNLTTSFYLAASDVNLPYKIFYYKDGNIDDIVTHQSIKDDLQ